MSTVFKGSRTFSKQKYVNVTSKNQFWYSNKAIFCYLTSIAWNIASSRFDRTTINVDIARLFLNKKKVKTLLCRVWQSLIYSEVIANLSRKGFLWGSKTFTTFLGVTHKGVFLPCVEALTPRQASWRAISRSGGRVVRWHSTREGACIYTMRDVLEKVF